MLGPLLILVHTLILFFNIVRTVWSHATWAYPCYHLFYFIRRRMQAILNFWPAMADWVRNARRSTQNGAFIRSKRVLRAALDSTVKCRFIQVLIYSHLRSAGEDWRFSEIGLSLLIDRKRPARSHSERLTQAACVVQAEQNLELLEPVLLHKLLV